LRRKISRNPQLRNVDPISISEDAKTLLRSPVFSGVTWRFVSTQLVERSSTSNTADQLRRHSLQLRVNCYSDDATLWDGDIEVTYSYAPRDDIGYINLSKTFSVDKFRTSTIKTATRSSAASIATSIANTLMDSKSPRPGDSEALMDPSQRSILTSGRTSYSP
jgi:hypothetical protein